MKNAKSSAFPYDFDEEKHCGLSIREYFAIKCLPVFIKNNLDDNENSYDDNAAKAVKSADALINALNQTKNAD